MIGLSSVTSLIFGDKVAIGDLTIDAVVTETHELEATVTTSPVEAGVQIADHVIVQPAQITLEGIISENPLGLGGLLSSAATSAAGALGSSIGGIAGSVATVAGGSLAGYLNSELFGRSKASAFAHLEGLLVDAKARTPSVKLVTIVSGLKSYENMVMTSLSAPRDSKTGGALRFTATFQEVRVVTPAFGEIALAAVEAATPSVSKGQQAASAAGGAAASASSNQTNLQQLVNYTKSAAGM